MRITTLALITAPIALAACGTKVYDVQPYGQNQFVVYSKSKNMAESHTKSVEAANAYCAEKSKSMQPVKSDKVARRQFEFVFACK